MMSRWMVCLVLFGTASCTRYVEPDDVQYGLAARPGPAAPGAPHLASLGTAEPRLGARGLRHVSAADFRVVVDPGHGGKDPGATAHGREEKALAWDLARKLYQKLKASGVPCTMTRWDDRFQPLAARVDLAEHFGADLFVSVHVNAAQNPAAEGLEVIYKSLVPKGASGRHVAQSKRAADRVGEALRTIPGAKWRGVKTNERHLYVLKQASHAAVLVELGFVTNAAEARRLADDDYQDLLAHRVYEGVLAYFDQGDYRR